MRPAREVRPAGRCSRSLGGGTFLLLALAPLAGAQDLNYWSIQYGPVAQLVGGQVIASSRDLSATFYNPGALALEQKGTFLLSTESLQVESFSIQSHQSSGLLDVSSSRFGSAPSLVAGTLPRRWLGEETRLAWSFLIRQELKVRLGQRRPDVFELPGGRSLAEFTVDAALTEGWGGLTVSRRLSERLGLGATLYGVYRGQRSRTELSAQAVSAEGAGASIFGVEDFDYSHTRLLAKAGLAYEGERLELGLSVTTPGVGLFGSGKAGSTVSIVGIDADGDAVPDPPLLVAEQGENLPTAYRSTWAVGAGASWARGPARFYVSAEWFAPLDRNTVMTLPSDIRSAELTQQMDSVLNAGLGVEHRLAGDVTVYGAFRTDFSAASGDPDVNVAFSNWDLYHLSAGTSFRAGGSQFTLGATYSFGAEARPFPSPVPVGDLPGDRLDTEIDIRYRRLVLLLGFLFGE